MPIKLGQGCYDAATFVNAHQPNAHLPPGPPVLGPNDFIVGRDFFTVKTVAELQQIIDTTSQMMKKLDFLGNAATVAEAKDLINQAKSDSETTLTVRWGLHQSEDRPIGVGKTQHFTLVGNPADWHLYVNTDGKRIGFMSNGAGPGNLVTITKY